MKTSSSLLLLVFFFSVLKGQDTAFPALPDSCFDRIFFTFPIEQLRIAKAKFNRQLDSLLNMPRPDSFALGVVHRRLGTIIYYSEIMPDKDKHALKSLNIFQNFSSRDEAQLAQSRLVYAYSLFRTGSYDTITTMIKLAIEKNKMVFGDVSEFQEAYYQVLGIAHNNISRFNEALIYINHALEIGRKIHFMPDLNIARGLYFRGTVLYNHRQYDAALEDFREMEELLRKIPGNQNLTLGTVFQWIGMCCIKTGDYERALNYLQQSLILREQFLGSDHELTLFVRSYLADLYLEVRDFNNAVFHQEKVWAGYTKNDPNFGAPDKACKMVQLYATIGDYQKEDQAFKYLNEKCSGFGKQGNVHEYSSFGYRFHALSLINRKRLEEAIFWIDKASEINQITNSGNHRYNHETLLLKAEALTQLQRFNDAIAILQDILYHSPLPNSKKQALTKLADIHFKKFKNSSQQVELQQSWNYQLQALHTLDSMRYTYQSAASRIQQAELNFHLFESALNTSYERQDLSSSFWVAEKSKASALLDNQRDDLARRIAGLPDSLLHRESGLKSQIAELEKTVYEKPAGTEKTSAEAALFEKKQSLNTLLQGFEKNYPLYFKFKYNTTLADVKLVQANLPPATAMLEYFVGDSAIFIFSITPSSFQVQRIPKSRDFEDKVQGLRQSLTSAELRFLKQDFTAFSLAANKLYQDLLAAPLALLPPGIQHLIIVPDGSLNYVPFEVLGKNAGSNDFKTYPFLLKNYSISYATSANLWLEQTKPQSNQGPQNSTLELFAGFAPSYSSSDTLSSINSRTRSLLVRDEQYEIPGAALEVQEIAKLLNGKTWLGEAATKTQFKQQSPHFRVLHLAMHSIMDDANPLFSRLLFTQLKNTVDDNDLYANDLYNLRLPAQMVVLSACNTGNGKLRRGEGVMSLSRAFTYTGVPSTVMSLWKAPDEATRRLMVDFYKNLKMGLAKDEALQKAKLSQLAGAESGLSSPFFWAGFVANGDMRALF